MTRPIKFAIKHNSFISFLAYLNREQKVFSRILQAHISSRRLRACWSAKVYPLCVKIETKRCKVFVSAYNLWRESTSINTQDFVVWEKDWIARKIFTSINWKLFEKKFFLVCGVFTRIELDVSIFRFTVIGIDCYLFPSLSSWGKEISILILLMIIIP